MEKGSKKFRCPNCGKEKRYVRYIDNETNTYLDIKYGRCDREQECGYHNQPSYDSGTISSSNFNSAFTRSISYIDYNNVSLTLKAYDKNSFVRYLKSIYQDNKVDEVIKQYRVGTSMMYGGSPVFWQIDTTGKARSGKIMGYSATTGKRNKNHAGTPNISYAHTALKLNEFNYKQCLFGEHLIVNHHKSYGVVESEKTAVIMSLEIPEYVWVSVNGKGNFNKKILNSLKGKNVVAYPDKGCFDDWNKVAIDANLDGFSIHVSNLVEISTDVVGEDIADIFLRLKSLS